MFRTTPGGIKGRGMLEDLYITGILFFIFYLPQMVTVVLVTPFVEKYFVLLAVVIAIPKIVGLIFHDNTIVNKINLIINWFLKLIALFLFHPFRFYKTLFHPNMWRLNN